ncbi:MAG: hypothetical protein H0V45_10075 [Actinobacteria bacterium]|nr:hypothetical protein [Actinomycetota bacterium]
MNARGARIELLAGVVAVIGWLLAVLVLEAFGDSPADDAGPQQLLEYFQNEEGSIYIGAICFFVGSGALLWFGGVLREAIAATGLDRLATIAFGATVATAVLTMGLLVPQVSAAFEANESEGPLSPEAAQALWVAGDGFFVAAEFTAATLLLAVALATLRSRMLPTWLAWLSLVIALVLVIPPIGWAALIFGFPIWILLVTFFLWKRTETEPALTPGA